jgi:hypothetical protein
MTQCHIGIMITDKTSALFMTLQCFRIAHVTIQNIQMWNEENPCAIQQVPSHRGML